ncbi:MAG TPA: hypothetical protein VML55_15215 [Planctomycetaceae bacterium]|nr:hypothetical protein [Planctomycetaceae bacterium]
MMLGLAPTEEPLTAELMAEAEQMWREQPPDHWRKRWLGLAQLRAGKLPEAVATLEASLMPAVQWQNDGIVWPLLAIAQHNLGNAEIARRWLDKAAFWLALRNEAESQRVSAATGDSKFMPETWLYALVFYLEARALIDGPEAAVAARDLLATQARERSQAVQARAAAVRQERLAKAEAAWQHAVDLAGDDPVPWIQRGHWYADRGEQAKADADFARAFKLDPQHPYFRLNRARQNRTVVAEWDFSQGAAGWRAGYGRLTSGNAVLAMESQGSDPWYQAEVTAPAGRHELTICARFEGVMEVQLFWAAKPAAYSGDQSVRFTITGDAQQWREYRFGFTSHSDVVSLRFDPPNEGSPRIELAWMLLANYSTEADFQRTVELAGDDPLPWIHRGRWYAERGEHEKADADFAKAASLTPNELNKFLEAGWWVVGPYPGNLNELCPPEIDPDPSKPVYTIDAESGPSDKPSAWAHVPSGAYGTIDLSGVLHRSAGSSVYALAQVHSPEERNVLLMIGKTEPLRVWVNGALIEAFAPGEYPVLPPHEQFHRLPIVLRAGRNTFLIKCASPKFTVRIGDTPRDRAILLADQRRFTEALVALNELPFSPAELESRFLTWIVAPILTRHEGPYDLYQLHCAAALARIAQAETQAWLRFRISYVCSQRPNRLFDEHAERLVSLAEQYAEATPGTWTRLNAALVNYRAGHSERAQSLLTASDLAHPLSLPLQALLHHARGDASSAAKSLDAALSAAAERENGLRTADRSDFRAAGWAGWWYEWAAFLNLLAEAEQAIQGETAATDGLKASGEKTAAERWTEAPELAAFDHAVLFTARGPGGALKYPQPLLARGGRLAELQRFDEAEADFNQAVKLAPDDIEALVARARFHAERGNVDHARTDFDAALKLARTAKAGVLVGAVEREFGRHDEVLAAWQKLDPDAEHFWRIRAERQLWLCNWKEAAELFSQGNPHALHELFRAGLGCLLDDAEGYERACQRHAELSETISDPSNWNHHRLFLLSLRPIAADQATEFQRLLDECLKTAPTDNRLRSSPAVALYRHDRHAEALAALDEANAIGGWHFRAKTWPLRAMIHWKLGHPEEARRWLARAEWWIDLTSRAAERPHALNTDMAYPWGWLEANVFYREANTLINGPVEAARLHEEQQYGEAVAEWTRVLALEPADPPALRGRAAARFALGQFDEALADRSALVEAVKGTPQWPQAMIARGVVRRAAGDAPGAVADLSEALAQLDPERNPGLFGGAEYERCVAWLAAGDIDSLKRRCRELVQAHQTSASDALAVFIVACCKQHPESVDDWSPVLELARRCVRNKPENELYRKNLVAALCRSGRHEETLAYAAEAFPTEPSIGTQLWIALSHAALGRLDEARSTLAAAEARNEAAIATTQVELRLMAAEVRRFLEAREQKSDETDPGGK